MDHRADLYSLGIILFRLLSGELPYRSQNSLEVLIMHRNNPLPPFAAELQIPQDVIHMVQMLTAKTKTERYADAEKFLIELNRILNQEL